VNPGTQIEKRFWLAWGLVRAGFYYGHRILCKLWWPSLPTGKTPPVCITGCGRSRFCFFPSHPPSNLAARTEATESSAKAREPAVGPAYAVAAVPVIKNYGYPPFSPAERAPSSPTLAALTPIEQAVAFARGVPGMMLPAHGEAGPDDAMELLRFAARIEAAA
jgi:hypothetical protein